MCFQRAFLLVLIILKQLLSVNSGSYKVFFKVRDYCK